MKQQTEMLEGINAYQQHDYISALKHFAALKQNPQNEAQQLVLQTLMAVTNLQLCNYNQAGKTLHRIRERIEQLQNHDLLTSELLVVKCKVMCNLMILELLNCNQAANEYLQQLVDTIKFAMRRSKSTGVALFKVSIKSLFGFQSFADINAQISHLTNKKQIISTNLTSPIYCTALAIYANLSGQHKQAYHLQMHSYELAKQKHSLLAVLALRHLQELCVLLKDETGRKSHQRELKKLMSNELQGVAEQTLFRNYDKKLQLASSIVQKLAREQQLILEQQINEGIDKVAVVWKLSSMQRTNPNNKIEAVLELIRQNKDVMGVMGQNEFVKQAVKQYKASVTHLAETISRITKNLFFGQLIKACKAQPHKMEINYGTRRGILQLNSQEHTESIQVSRINRSVDSNASSHKKHKVYATSFYLAKEPKQGSFTQNRSNLVVNKPKKNEQPSTHRDKDNTIYKISKADQPRVQVKQQRPKNKEVVLEKQLDLRQYFINNTVKPDPKPASKLNEPNNLSKVGKEQKNQVPVLRMKEKQSKALLQSNLRQKQKIINVPQNSTINIKQSHDRREQEFIKTTSNIFSQNKVEPSSKFHPQYIKPSRLVPENANGEVDHLQHKFKRSEIPSFTSITARELAQKKILRIINQCQSGQYIEKRHYTSDGGAERFLQLNKNRDKISWADNEEAIDFNSSSSSYSMNDIRGILYGKVTQTLRKECNAKLDSTKCFSLVLKKRTLDFYCPKEVDIFFWVPGISACLKEFIFQNEKYQVMKKSRGKQQSKICNKLQLDNQQLSRYYSVGRMLWRCFLMRLKNEFVADKKKEQYRKYKNPNAFAIVAAAVKRMGFKSSLSKIS